MDIPTGAGYVEMPFEVNALRYDTCRRLVSSLLLAGALWSCLTVVS